MDRARTAAQVLAEAVMALGPVTETPRLDAEILLAHSVRLSRSQLLTRLRDPIDAPGFEALVERRLNSEPIAYILGEWEFFSLAFFTRPPILVPRPETEHLVEAALDHLKDGQTARRILDIGTGTGCVAVSIAKNAPGNCVVATDINADALVLARENAARHNAEIEFRRGDLFGALAPMDGPFDVIVSNPPYVESTEWPKLPPVIRRHEDPRALLAGEDGLDVLRRIIAEAPGHLNPGGMLAVEMGENHSERVRALFEHAGFRDTRRRDDLAGIPRIAQGICPG